MIEQTINITANDMSVYYYNLYYRKNSKHPFNKSHYERTFKPKYFKYFLKASSMFCVRENFKPKLFIDCCLADGFIYPQQICIESNWQKFINYSNYTVDEKKETALRILSGAMEIKKYGNVEKLLSDRLMQISLFQNRTRFDPLILFFSRTFCKFYEDNKSKFVTPLNLSVHRYSIFEYKDIIKKIKEFLINDYFEFEI